MNDVHRQSVLRSLSLSHSHNVFGHQQEMAEQHPENNNTPGRAHQLILLTAPQEILQSTSQELVNQR